MILMFCFNWLKKKYPNGSIQNLAVIETDKLSQQVKDLITVLTPQEAEDAVIQTAKAKMEDIVNVIKNKISEVKK